jgi:hypothetical protein
VRYGNKDFSSLRKNALAYAGIVVVNSEVVELSTGFPSRREGLVTPNNRGYNYVS